MASEQSPTNYKIRLGAELEAARLRAGMSREDAAKMLACSVGKIRTIERGEVGIKAIELRALLDHYRVADPLRADLEHLGAEANRRRSRTPWGSAIPERLKKFFNIEETASVLQVYLPETIHGYLQTEEYARAVIGANPEHSADDVERLVQARMARRGRLLAPDPPQFEVVIPESVLRNPVGGRDVMARQIQELDKLARLKNVTIQVLPADVGAHRATGAGPFTILTPTVGTQKLVYIETLVDGLWIEEPGRVGQYTAAFAELMRVSVGGKGTRSLLDTVRTQL